jgi:hypothetical protein
VRPLSDSALERLTEACRVAGPLDRVVVAAGELRDLVEEARRHREIAAALVSDEPDSRFDAQIVAIRRTVSATVQRNLVSLVSQIVDRLQRRAAASRGQLEELAGELRAAGSAEAMPTARRLAFHYQSGRADAFDSVLGLVDEVRHGR